MIHAKGFGFITDDESRERFLHASDLAAGCSWMDLREGNTVEFEPVDKGPRDVIGKRHGLCVTNVKVVAS